MGEGDAGKVQRMEAEKLRCAAEVQRREAQQAAKREPDLCTMRKVLSRQVAVEHLQGLKEKMLLEVKDAGVFADVESMAVETKFLPALYQMVTQQIQNTAEEHVLADAMIRSTVAEKLDQHAKMLDIERRRLALIDEAERQAREEKQEALAQKQAEEEQLKMEQRKMMEWEAAFDPAPKPDEALEDATATIVPVTEEQLPALQELSSAAVRPSLDDLQRTQLLGLGGFGAVYCCHASSTPGRKYALKRISKGFIVEAGEVAQQRVCAERNILSRMDCDFITRFYGSYQDTEFVYMLLEMLPGGHLLQLLCDKPQVLLSDTSAAMFYSGCVILAFEYLHRHSIAFRDLKLENVLLDNRGYAKLCDMGFAGYVSGDKTHTLLGTPSYMAPELIDHPHGHNKMVDYWSLGVLTYEMMNGGKAPWDVNYDDDPVHLLVALRESYNQGLPHVPVRFLPRSLGLARDFIKQLLVVDPKRRLGANGIQEVKNSGWFTDGKFSWQQLTAQTLPTPYLPPPVTYSEGPPKPAQASRDSMCEGNKLFVKNTEQDDWAADF